MTKIPVEGTEVCIHFHLLILGDDYMSSFAFLLYLKMGSIEEQESPYNQPSLR